jgi:hypothetical protein
MSDEETFAEYQKSLKRSQRDSELETQQEAAKQKRSEKEHAMNLEIERKRDADMALGAKESAARDARAQRASSKIEEARDRDMAEGALLSQAKKKVESANIFQVNKIKQQGNDAAKKQKDLEERAAKIAELEKKEAEKRFRASEKAKTEEFKEMQRKNEARIRVNAEEQSRLLNAKTANERIKIRNQIDARQRAERAKEKSDAHNKSELEKYAADPSYTITRGMITPGTIKDAIKRKSMGITPAIGNVATGGTSALMGILGTPMKNPTTFYQSETKQLSKAIKPHAKMPVTGGKVKTPVMHGMQVGVNPNFENFLLGIAPLQTQTAKKQKIQGDNKSDMFGRLNKMMRFV